MTHLYPHVWAQVQRVSRFDKYASESDEAQADLARVSHEVFGDFIVKSSAYGETSTPHHVAANAAAFAVDLYDSARATGVKVASENEATSSVEQLATVAYLDEVLKTACEKLSGDSLDTALRARYLGREYGVELLKTLVG